MNTLPIQTTKSIPKDAKNHPTRRPKYPINREASPRYRRSGETRTDSKVLPSRNARNLAATSKSAITRSAGQIAKLISNSAGKPRLPNTPRRTSTIIRTMRSRITIGAANRKGDGENAAFASCIGRRKSILIDGLKLQVCHTSLLKPIPLLCTPPPTAPTPTHSPYETRA